MKLRAGPAYGVKAAAGVESVGRLLRDYVFAVGLYLLVVGGGVVLTLILSSAIGYLPYSDRPGPGWHGPVISFSQVAYYLSWATLLLVPSLLWATILFAFLRVLQLLGGPKILIRSVGGVCAGFVSLVSVAGAGWYIAIAAFPVLVAAGLGAIWGLVLLPRYLGPRPLSEPGRARSVLVGLLAVGVPAALYWVFFLPGYSQQLEVNVVRVSRSENALSADGWIGLEPAEVDLLSSLFPRGDLHYCFSGSSGPGPDGARSRVLVVVTEPLDGEAHLEIPKGASVVYVQRGESWIMYPSTASTLRQAIKLGPGSRPDEMSFSWPHGDASVFTCP